MDAPQSFLKEMKKYSVVRPTTWQGPSARGGVKVDIASVLSSKEEASNGTDVTMNEQANISSPLWTRLSNATGSATLGAAVVRLMQKHLLENVDNIPLDEIELLASGNRT